MIAKTELHAIRALVMLAGLPNGQSAAVIADRIGAPPNYLGKLLHKLAREGLLESRKGPGGGFRLARSPRSIRLVHIVDPIRHVSHWEACFLGKEQCSDEAPCAMHEQWKSLRDDYVKMLSETTLADLMDRTPGERPS